MGRWSALEEFLTGSLMQHPTRVRAFMDTLDDAAAARLLAAAEAGDNRAILKAMADQTWGAAPGRPAPAPAAPSGSRSPMSFEDRVVNDPNIRGSIEAAGGQVPQGGAEAVLEAYRGSIPTARRGRPARAEDSIRELAKPADQATAESIAGQFDRATFTDDAARQTELPFDDEPNVNAFGLDESSPIGWSDSEPVFFRAADYADESPAAPPRATPNRAGRRLAGAAAGAAAAAGGAYLLSRNDGGITEAGNPADLKEDPVSASDIDYDTYVRPDPFAPPPAEIIMRPRGFYQMESEWKPFDRMPADSIGKPLPLNPKEAPVPTAPAARKKPAPPSPEQLRSSFASLDHAALVSAVHRITANPRAYETNDEDFDYAKAAIDEYNFRITHPNWGDGSRQRPAIRNPFREYDERQKTKGDLTESGNPAELAVNPVAPPSSNSGAASAQSVAPQQKPAPTGGEWTFDVRSSRRPDAPPDNVQSDMEAAATPVTPDAEVGAKPPVVPSSKAPQEGYKDRLVAAGYSPEQADKIIAFESTQRGGLRPQDYTDEELRASAGRARQRDQRTAGFDQAQAEARGHTYSGLTAPSATVTVDGYTIPSFLGATGQPMGDGQYYRLRDLAAAQEAADDARRLAGHRQMVEDDIAKYGHYSIRDTDDALTPAQEEARDARKRAETNQRAQVERQRQVQIANKNRELTPYEAQQKERADRFAAMARLAGGSQGLRGGEGGNVGMFQALAMLEGADPHAMTAQQRNLQYALPGGREAAAVDAQNQANAGRIAQQVVTGMLANQENISPERAAAAEAMRVSQMTPEQQVAYSRMRREPMGTGYSAAHVGSKWNFWMNNTGVRGALAREQNFRMEMEGLGYQPAEIDAFIDQRRRAGATAGAPAGSAPPAIPSVGYGPA